MAGLSDKGKKITVRVIAAYVLLGGALSLLGYVTQAYLPFIASGDAASTYVPAALRLTCRIGYPLAGIALFMLHRSGLWLLVMVWLAQLLPSSIFLLLQGGDISRNMGSLIEFGVVVGLLYALRSVLTPGKILKPLALFLVATLALHSIVFLMVPKSEQMRSELLGAVYENDEAAVKRLLSDAGIVQRELDPQCPPNTRCKPITFATESGNLNILKMLLDAGADPNGATSIGDTPLIIAIMSEQSAALDMLLQYKADVNQMNKFGASAFTGATGMGDYALVEKFLQHGADVNKPFPFRNPITNQVQENTTPLSVAVQAAQPEMMKATDEQTPPPEVNYPKVVKLLLENKADASIKDSLGKTAADYATQGSDPEIKALFDSHK
jgi:ankyrin repeat protein